MKEIRNGMPYAYITKNKQRVKQFDNTIYLNNGDEFEIEIYNPTQENILAKIFFQGRAIGEKPSFSITSGSINDNEGIVVRPGQRIFLERFLDDNKKFVFETYQVSKSNETFNAIAKNGDVRIEFYLENRMVYNPYSATQILPGYVTTTNIGGYVTGINSGSIIGDSMVYGNGVTNLNTASVNYVNYSNTMDTGRVEKGSVSDQEFVSVYMKFSSNMFCSSKWKILPVSEKHKFSEDIKTYCTSCGTKRKKDSYKFCPNCGTKFSQRKNTEIHYILQDNIILDGKRYIMSTYNGTLDNFLKRYENKLIYIKRDSLTSDSLRAIVID
jgi:predicted RNA-binding Zn-ribbon protein involved in translation (DUF1610 family)